MTKKLELETLKCFFADLSTGAHSPSMISQGRIGALVTAKPTDRRAILEEAANISGLHVRRHEAELRLNAAETNLKRADELRRQQEKQLANLQKQAEEATKYKLISEEIKKIEAGLYYLKLLDIDNEIRIENEINNEAEGEVSNFNQQIAQFENLIKTETDKVSPLREKNIENLSKIQRLNLELQNLDEENVRTQDEIENIKKSLKTIEEDIDREKGIVIDANSNERRLKEEKAELIEIDSKYFETEKLSNEDLEKAKNLLKDEQKSVDEIINIFADGNINIAIGPIKNVKNTITRAKELINNNEINQALTLLDRCQIEIDGFLDNLEDEESKKKLSNINEKNENIKLLQEKYADSFSKNQSIKKESVKRNERIKAIESEVESWKNLLSNSEKMVTELTERKNKLLSQLNERDQQPKAQAERKGQITEGLRISQNEKIENEKIIEETDKKINSLRLELNDVQERSIQIRERKASSGATVEGLKKRKEDLLERVSSELNLEENDILENSNLNGVEELPDSVAQEDALDKKKNEREKLGSVNLRADEETSKYEIEIKKMEQDREDLVSAIIKLKESINELNQKGRERLLEAFEKVNRKFNEVYTKLFNGGNAKLELVDSDDPLEAGLEMLVSPPGKRLQSITLLSGGEQALTALSLIFAVFLTNPSPICVLDEVDAPLDDANVTRFCGLLDDLTKITDTKFIIVTHHALTMSKMNRLYGVTMPEKGISQLVAVDLQKAESMVA
ncbi:chromosome segregation protein SMC [Candidatus Pelagibacter ubique]|nr:chromosome segregation protein SMC [Candidatus Pelagibacter ubique]